MFRLDLPSYINDFVRAWKRMLYWYDITVTVRLLSCSLSAWLSVYNTRNINQNDKEYFQEITEISHIELLFTKLIHVGVTCARYCYCWMHCRMYQRLRPGNCLLWMCQSIIRLYFQVLLYRNRSSGSWGSQRRPESITSTPLQPQISNIPWNICDRTEWTHTKLFIYNADPRFNADLKMISVVV